MTESIPASAAFPPGDVDIAGLFDTCGPDRSDRWDLVRSLVEAFWGPILPEHQVGESELDEAEARLGTKLPVALREGYRLVGAHPAMSGQDHLLAPDELTVADSGLLRFRIENQAVAAWACCVDGRDDPLMYIRADGAWQPDAGTVSEFFVHMVLSEILLGAPFADNCPADDRRIEQLEDTARQLPVAPFAFWPAPELPPRRFFGGPGLLIADDARSWIWVAALTDELLNNVRREITGGWMMLPDST